jgi:hypothetical protein
MLVCVSYNFKLISTLHTTYYITGNIIQGQEIFNTGVYGIPYGIEFNVYYM